MSQEPRQEQIEQAFIAYNEAITTLHDAPMGGASREIWERVEDTRAVLIAVLRAVPQEPSTKRTKEEVAKRIVDLVYAEGQSGPRILESRILEVIDDSDLVAVPQEPRQEQIEQAKESVMKLVTDLSGPLNRYERDEVSTRLDELIAVLRAVPQELPNETLKDLNARLQMKMSLNADEAQAEQSRLTARISYLEGTALPHARKQEHANGFQAGWHTALARIRSGDSLDELAEVVPGQHAVVPQETEIATRRMTMSQHCKHAQHSKCDSTDCWCVCHRASLAAITAQPSKAVEEAVAALEHDITQNIAAVRVDSSYPTVIPRLKIADLIAAVLAQQESEIAEIAEHLKMLGVEPLPDGRSILDNKRPIHQHIAMIVSTLQAQVEALTRQLEEKQGSK